MARTAASVRPPPEQPPSVTAAARVGIVGLFGQGNLGNDGSLEAMVTYLRRDHPDASIDVLCSGPEHVAAQMHLPTAYLRWYRRTAPRRPGKSGTVLNWLELGTGIGIDAYRVASWVRRHDVVIVPGMGVLETTLPLRPWKRRT